MRTRAPIVVALVLLAAALAGCGEESDCCALPPKVIAYELRGGQPPSHQELEIGEDGRATVLLEGFGRRPETISFTVEEAELDAVRSELDGVDFDALALPERSCFDCPSYEIRYGADEFSADRTTIPPELIGIFERLDRVIDEAEDGRGGT